MPEGIDPGFEYNPGRASFGEFTGRFERRPVGTLVPLSGQKTAADYGLGALPVLGDITLRRGFSRNQALKAFKEKYGDRFQKKIAGVAVTVEPTALFEHIKKDPRRFAYIDGLFLLLDSTQTESWLTFFKDSKTGKVYLRNFLLGRIVADGSETGEVLILESERGIVRQVTFYDVKSKKMDKFRFGLNLR